MDAAERKVALTWASALVSPLCRFAVRAAKADDAGLKRQNEFYEKSYHPLDTRP